ncbi:MaoC family dehydratase N-terminal domain-containing protein [Paenibacillus dokdonensis]|uniref:MaoC family dehydratase N-terminal domain-containing protein n=1 Tax=Paenibacillus dokdonensis TaxID=2567944 RepID=A0ABU6GKN8_9BACL|nr:MaoC family dehydratase N-terminal domain-containing protein [Paenibacillus dokdonensis]MEC0240273.1 MaoC family dehydratase N-terminal domain-containing protein [Paenibacillus dokdonensis]
MNRIHHQVHITAEWISHYADSIEAPLQSIHGNLIAPATMPVIFWQAFDIPWMNMDTPLMHGSQRFSYEAPITAGMILDCELALTNVERKEGKRGVLTFFTHTLVCTCDGELIVTADTVLIRVGDDHEKTHNL